MSHHNPHSDRLHANGHAANGSAKTDYTQETEWAQQNAKATLTALKKNGYNPRRVERFLLATDHVAAQFPIQAAELCLRGIMEYSGGMPDLSVIRIKMWNHARRARRAQLVEFALQVLREQAAPGSPLRESAINILKLHADKIPEKSWTPYLHERIGDLKNIELAQLDPH